MRHSNLKQDINLYHKIHGEREQLLLYGQQTRPTILGRIGGRHSDTEALRHGPDGYCDRHQTTAWKCPTVVHRQPCIGPARHRSPCLLFVSTAASFVFCRTFMQTVAGCPVLQLSQAESGPHYSQKYPPSEVLFGEMFSWM